MTKKISFLGLLVLTTVFSGCNTQPNSQIAQVTSPSKTVVEPTSQPAQTVAKEEKPKIEEKKIGEESLVGGMTLKVNSYKETQTLTAQYSSPVAASEGTKFILVDLTLTNEGNSDALFFADNNFKLIDTEKNREYTTDGDNITSVDNYLASRKLAPGIPERGIIIYKVPKTMAKYALVALNDPLNTNSTGISVLLRTEGETQELVPKT